MDNTPKKFIMNNKRTVVYGLLLFFIIINLFFLPNSIGQQRRIEAILPIHTQRNNPMPLDNNRIIASNDNPISNSNSIDQTVTPLPPSTPIDDKLNKEDQAKNDNDKKSNSNEQEEEVKPVSKKEEKDINESKPNAPKEEVNPVPVKEETKEKILPVVNNNKEGTDTDQNKEKANENNQQIIKEEEKPNQNEQKETEENDKQELTKSKLNDSNTSKSSSDNIESLTKPPLITPKESELESQSQTKTASPKDQMAIQRSRSVRVIRSFENICMVSFIGIIVYLIYSNGNCNPPNGKSDKDDNKENAEIEMESKDNNKSTNNRTMKEYELLEDDAEYYDKI